MSSGIREGRWLCKGCGAICLGRYESCNGDGTPDVIGCGRARPKGTRFFLPENSPYVTATELLADAASGVDWQCDHCDGANKGSVNGKRVISCAHCGNGRDASDTDDVVRDFAPGAAPAGTDDIAQIERAERALGLTKTRERRENRIRDEAAASERRLERQSAAGRSRPARHEHDAQTDRVFNNQYVKNDSQRKNGKISRGLILGLASGLAAILMIGFLFWSFLATTPGISRIDERGWAREIAIDQFVTLRNEGWSTPHDARILSQEIRQNGTRRVQTGTTTVTWDETERYISGSESYPCGTRDLGNGYFQDLTCDRNVWSSRQVTRSRQEPVYVQEPVWDTWYRYEIDRWVFERAVKTSGLDEIRIWPVVPILPADRREGGRSERLWIRIDHPDAPDESRNVGEAEWLSMPAGTQIRAHRNFWGHTRKIEIEKMGD